jgi:hypothetical protein
LLCIHGGGWLAFTAEAAAPQIFLSLHQYLFNIYTIIWHNTYIGNEAGQNLRRATMPMYMNPEIAVKPPEFVALISRTNNQPILVKRAESGYSPARQFKDKKTSMNSTAISA